MALSFGEKCFSMLAKARQDNGGTIGRQQWIAIVDTLFSAEKPAPSAPRKKTTLMTDEEWMQSLMHEPCLAGVDIQGQLALAQFWCKNNNRKCTRRFFTNWLNKAERTITLPGGKQTVVSRDPYKEPDGWRTSDFARRALKLSHESWEILTSKDWLDLDTNYRSSILRGL